MNGRRTLWVTQTALFLALLVAAQLFTRPLGQFVTGSSVNFVLVISCLLAGFSTAAAIAVVSPLLAFVIIGVPAVPLIIPFIMAGNLVLVAAMHFLSGKSFARPGRSAIVRLCVAAVIGAVLKCLTLWFGVTQVVLVMVPGLGQAQRDALAALFSWPQLVTALIGAGLAIAATPTLRRALGERRP